MRDYKQIQRQIQQNYCRILSLTLGMVSKGYKALVMLLICLVLQNTADVTCVFSTTLLQLSEEDWFLFFVFCFFVVSMNGWSRCSVGPSALNIHCTVFRVGTATRPEDTSDPLQFH